MQDREQQQGGFLQDLKNAETLLYFAADVLGRMQTVPLRTPGSSGERYHRDFRSTAAWVVMFCWAPSFWGEDILPMYWCGLLVSLLLVAGATARRWKGAWGKVHSYYTGESVFTRHLGVKDEVFAKLWLEPALLVAAGAAALSWNVPLGAWLLAGAVGAHLITSYHEARVRATVLGMRDAQAENEHVLSRFKKGR